VANIVRLDHVQLAMPAGGEADAEAFYSGLLGIPRVPKPEPLAARGGAWFEDGSGLRVHLGVEEDFRPARKAHPGFVVSGLDALLDRLAAAGHPHRPGDDVGGVRQVYVDDPFGNRIELIEPQS
jgi:catechol 2,3-dioxygenase-like lactoylglutathione lyase family enzyme